MLALKTAFIVYERTNKPFTSNSTVHATLVLDPNSTLHDASQHFDKWLDEVCKLVGTGRYGVSYFGARFTLNSVGSQWPHIHIVIRTVKSRKTGLTISRLDCKDKDRLCAYWESLAGRPARGKACILETVFHMPKLIGYMAGVKNADRPMQQMHLITSSGY